MKRESLENLGAVSSGTVFKNIDRFDSGKIMHRKMITNCYLHDREYFLDVGEITLNH